METKLKAVAKQQHLSREHKDFGYCGVIALANLLHDEEIYNRFFGNEKFRASGIDEQNAMLKEVNSEITIRPVLYASHQFKNLPVAYVWNVITTQFLDVADKQAAMPYLLTVKISANVDYSHVVSVLYANNQVFYCDPYKGVWQIVTNEWHLATLTREIWGVDSIAHIDDDGVEKWAYINGKRYHPVCDLIQST